MAGHLGAAVVAGYFIGEDFSDLYSEASASIKSELDRIMRGDEALWFDQEKAGLSIPQLFSPGPQSKKQGDPTKITQALAQNIGTMRASGHNVIFAALASEDFKIIHLRQQKTLFLESKSSSKDSIKVGPDGVTMEKSAAGLMPPISSQQTNSRASLMDLKQRW